MTAITTAFQTAVSDMAASALGMIGSALPEVMPIAAAVCALTTGWSVIKRFTR